jgi:hypothetical protein
MSLWNWVDGKKPTIEPELHFLDDHADLVPLSPQEHQRNFLEGFLEEQFYALFATKVSSSRGNIKKEVT